MSQEERDCHYKEQLCFTCHKSGHMTKDCPDRRARVAEVLTSSSTTLAKLEEVKLDF
jgi:hypothetical protein